MKNYPFYQVDYYDTVIDFVRGIGKKYSESPAITVYDKNGEKQTYTYSMLKADVAGLSVALLGMGLCGKHVAIIGENSYEWLVTFLAVASIGSVVVPIDIDQSDDVIEQMVLKSDASALVFSADFSLLCQELKEEYPQIEHIISLENDFPCPNFSRLVAKGTEEIAKGNDIFTTIQTNSNALCIIFFTSGTTSTSKMVMLSQKNILINTSSAPASVFIDQGEKVFTGLPFNHSYGLVNSVLSMLVTGSWLCINGNTKTLFRDMALFEPETFITVPIVLNIMNEKLWQIIDEAGKTKAMERYLKKKSFLTKLGRASQPSFLKDINFTLAGHNLKKIVSGGAFLNNNIIENFNAIGIQIIQGYGITECSPLVSVNRNELSKFGSIGLPVSYCQVKIENDEILVKGDNVMLGYYKEPKLTEEAFEDGWFKTGDMGYIDKEGFLFITGRIKDLVVFNTGKKVSPEEIEEYVLSIPWVKECMVYGSETGQQKGDTVIAVLVYPDPEKTEGLSDYQVLSQIKRDIEIINRNLPTYKKINQVKLKKSEFAKTSTHKIKRYNQ